VRTSQIRQTAYHEAGHVIASIPTVGYPALATIVPDPSKNLLGRVAHYRIKQTSPEQLRTLKREITSWSVSDWDRYVRDILAMTLGGFVSEGLLRFPKREPWFMTAAGTGSADMDDAHELIELMHTPVAIADELSRLRPWMAKNWSHVDKVAKALLAKKTLAEDDLRDLVPDWIEAPV